MTAIANIPLTQREIDEIRELLAGKLLTKITKREAVIYRSILNKLDHATVAEG